MLKLAIIFVLPALVICQTQGQAAMAMVHAVDADGNGEISKSEVEAFFTQMDTSGDGRINRHEFDVFMVTVDPMFADHQAHFFDRFDFNGDHHVDMDDFDLSFAQHDLNGDGVISPDEFVNFQPPN